MSVKLGQMPRVSAFPMPMTDGPLLANPSGVPPNEIGRIYRGHEVVVTHEGTSQYSRGGSSACGLAALNCVRLVLGMENDGTKGQDLLKAMMDPAFMEEVMSICEKWPSNAHLELDEIQAIPLFENSLRSLGTDFGPPTVKHFRASMGRLSAKATGEHSTAVVITRPPEIVVCFKILTSEGDVYCVFDSHPRSNHPNGAAFIFNISPDQTAEYFADLLPFDRSLFDGAEALQWQVQLLGNASGHFFEHSGDEPGMDSSGLDAFLDANLKTLALEAEVRELKSQNTFLTEQNANLQNERDALKQEVRLLRREHLEKEERDRNQRDIEKRAWERREQQLKEDIEARGSASQGKGKERSTGGGWFDFFSSPAQEPDPPSDRPRSRFEPPPRTSFTFQRPDYTSEGRPGLFGMTPEEERLEYAQNLSRQTARREGQSSYGLRSDPPKSSKSTEQKSHASLNRTADPIGLSTDDYHLAYAQQLSRQYEEEDRRLRSQHNDLLKFAQTTFECTICMEEQPEDSIARIDPCDHAFCRECIRNFIQSKIQEHRFPIICPICATENRKEKSGTVDNDLIEQIGISDEDYAIFIEMQMAVFSLLMHCRGCKQSAFVDRQEYEAAEIINCPFPTCNNNWCKNCQQTVEPNGVKHSCDGTNELNNLMGKQGWKHCPGCRTPTEKVDGCNHMTCLSPGCNTHFCYVCGEKIVQSALRQEIQDAVQAHYSRCKLF